MWTEIFSITPLVLESLHDIWTQIIQYRIKPTVLTQLANNGSLYSLCERPIECINVASQKRRCVRAIAAHVSTCRLVSTPGMATNTHAQVHMQIEYSAVYKEWRSIQHWSHAFSSTYVVHFPSLHAVLHVHLPCNDILVEVGLVWLHFFSKAVTFSVRYKHDHTSHLFHCSKRWLGAPSCPIKASQSRKLKKPLARLNNKPLET